MGYHGIMEYISISIYIYIYKPTRMVDSVDVSKYDVDI